MNLANLFEMQKALDEKIVKEKGLEGQDLLPQKILALQVELGELANEWRGFKFWSKDQQPRIHENIHDLWSDEVIGERSPLLEEYVDCLHFILSIGLALGVREDSVWDRALHSDVNSQFLRMFETVSDLSTTFYNKLCQYKAIYDYIPLMYHFLGLGLILGFTWEQIEQAYIAKNEINHQRQAKGY